MSAWFGEMGQVAHGEPLNPIETLCASLGPISCARPDDENPKDRLGKAKPSMHFVPMIARLQEAIVMALGAKKYGSYNWREKKVLASVYSDAIDRHLAQWMDGEDMDEESGVSHLAHVRACCAILIDAIATGNLLDDRPKTASRADVGVIAAFFRSRQP